MKAYPIRRRTRRSRDRRYFSNSARLTRRINIRTPLLRGGFRL